jgi:hypothetical protein
MLTAEILNTGTVDSIKSGLLIASNFSWESFFRLLILILICSLVGFLFLFSYLSWKRKSDNKQIDFKNSIVDLVSDIPNILKIIEKLLDNQQELTSKIMGYPSIDRFMNIAKEYIKKFLYFCLLHKNTDDIKREFDHIIDSLSKETIDATLFKEMITSVHVIDKLLEVVSKNEYSEYVFERLLEDYIMISIQEVLKKNKKVNFVEVLQ